MNKQKWSHLIQCCKCAHQGKWIRLVCCKCGHTYCLSCKSLDETRCAK